MALFAGSTLLLLVFLYWATAGYMSRQLEETIAVEMRSLIEQHAPYDILRLPLVIQERIKANPQGSFLYLLITPNERRLAGNLNHWPQNINKYSDHWADFGFWTTTENPQRLHARGLIFRFPSSPLYLLVGRDIRELEKTRQLIRRALIWGLGFTLWMGLVGGILMSASLVRRIETINQTSRSIMSGQLSQRMPSNGTQDEFDQLADNLNSMLDRIEELMSAVRHVSDNIAHDLKTPLTRLRNRLEQLLHKPPTWETLQAKIAEAIGEADQLLNTFNALLRIARIESGRQGQREENVDLYALACDAAELYEVMAEEKDQHFVSQLESPAIVRGDRDLLFQALLNLLDNAIKYTPESGMIQFELVHEEHKLRVRITDSGIGIPSEERDKVLRRFYRVEQARNTPGNGLGLSLVAAVIELHQASLQLADNPQGQGLQVSVVFDAST